MTGRNLVNKIDVNDNIDRLLQSLDDIRGEVASLTARAGDEAAAAGHRGVRQAREMANELAGDWANRVEEGTTALRHRVEEPPVAATAFAFLAGLALGGVLMGAVVSGQRGYRGR
jgi:hypothetical protein